MRNELELMEKIERYLRHQLSAEEKAAFEQQMANDPALQEDVKLQQEVMKGIERASLQQHIQQAKIQFRRGRNFTRWGSAGLGVAILVTAIWYYTHQKDQAATPYTGKELPAYNETGGQQWASADSNIMAQVFAINAAQDTVIETKGGMVIAVPANGFLDATGQPVTGNVSLVVKEALNAPSIMMAGLSSMSGNQLLESGGMFFIDARKGEERLTINPAAGLQVEVPADTIKPGMQLYSGQRKADGTIDWVNPRPLEHDLVPMDILSLDFYPPHYLDSLRVWGYDSRNKKFTDSLYYSLSKLFAKRMTDGIQLPPSEEAVNDFMAGSDTVRSVERAMIDTGETDGRDYYYYHGEEGMSHLACGINPAKIKAIWTPAFQNTLLATREFAQRIPRIHESGDNDILDLYINNLDKSLSEIDSMAAVRLPGKLKTQFLAFAARKDGKLKGASVLLQKLRAYYKAQTKACMAAVVKTQDEFWKKQAALDNLATKKRWEHEEDSTNQIVRNFTQELNTNMKEAYRQLGYDTSLTPRFRNDNVYPVEITNTGWYNVDKAVYESTVTRTTLDHTDPSTGKKAVIQYLPASFSIDSAGKYDRLYVYLLPDQLSSFMRVTGSNGVYTEKLNELMQYTLVCIGYKGEQAFLYTEANVKPGDDAGIRLAAISQGELERALQKASRGTQAPDMQRELKYFLFESQDLKRRKDNEALLALIWRVAIVIFPCNFNHVVAAK